MSPCSSTTTRRPSRARPQAIADPTSPPPTTAKSYSTPLRSVIGSRGDAIDPHGIVVEELALCRERQVGDDRLKAAEDRIEAADQAVDGKIAGEHAALDTEDGDRVAHDRRVRLAAPRLAADAEAGDLQGNIGLARDKGQGS